MSTEQSPALKLFATLNGREFTDYREFDSVVQQALTEQRSQFPLTYTANQAISLASENGWIQTSNDMLQIKVP
jgi:hypothetical protein